MANITPAPISMSSLEIADLVESRHDKVKQSIERLAERGAIKLPPMGEVPNPGFGPKRIEVYQVGKRDSYVVVAQLSPEFTARLVDRWQELEGQASQARAISLPAIEAETFLLKAAADMLRLSETSILRGLTVIADNNGIRANYLPAYSDEGLTRALGDLLKEHGSPLSAVRANPILRDMGYLEQLERRAKGGPKKFWSITEAGQRFGKNETTPSNPNETQPRWYVSTFPALLAEINSYQTRSAA